MKQLMFKFLIFFMGVLLAIGCNPKQIEQLMQEAQPKIAPLPLEVHGDSINFVLSATLPEKAAKFLKPGRKVTAEVFYKEANDSTTKIGETIFDGDKYPKGTSKPASISESYSFAYKEGMTNGNVTTQITLQKGKKSVVASDLPPIGNGLITTSRLVLPTYYVSVFHSKHVNAEEYESDYVNFYFQKGRSNLQRKEIRSGRGDFLEDYASSQYIVRKVNIVGAHSPEGSTEINTKLASDRPETMQDYYTKLIENLDYSKDETEEEDSAAATTEETKATEFVIKPVVEDWSAFQDSLANYADISEEDKEKLVSIINGPGDFISKELALRKEKSYRKVVRSIYPKLRNAQLELVKVKDKLSDAEIYTLANQIANGDTAVSFDTLGNELFFYAADKLVTEAEGLDQKIKLYTACTKHIADAASFNNLGAYYLKKAQKEVDASKRDEWIEQAQTALDSALAKEATAEALANLAGIQMFKGNLGEALLTLEKLGEEAKGENVDKTIKFIKGYEAITKANYADAIDNLSSAGEDAVTHYDRALTHLLKGSLEKEASDFQTAIEFFDKAIEADDQLALAYYGKAISSARTDNVEDLFTNLKKAATLDADLKTRAVSDLEFAKYFNNERFKEALQ